MSCRPVSCCSTRISTHLCAQQHKERLGDDFVVHLIASFLYTLTTNFVAGRLRIRGARVLRVVDDVIIQQENLRICADIALGVHGVVWMEYRRDSAIRLASSASLIHRNLCVARGLQSEESVSYAVAHKATVNIVHVADGASTQQETIDYEATKDKDTMAFITQVSRQLSTLLQLLCE